MKPAAIEDRPVGAGDADADPAGQQRRDPRERDHDERHRQQRRGGVQRRVALDELEIGQRQEQEAEGRRRTAR